MARRIVCTGIIFILIVTGLTLSTVTSPAAALDATSASVQIVYTWQRVSGRDAYNVTVNCLGTLIAPNMILTHNHYGHVLGYGPSDSLVITDQANRSWHGRAVDAQLIVINAGTAVIWLPEKLSWPVATLVDSADLQRFAADSWLSVSYRDATTAQLVQHDFRVIQIKDGIAQLADPDRAIGPGASGGGVYFNGKLIGNVWSINLDSARRPIGSFNVALLPSAARRYVK